MGGRHALPLCETRSCRPLALGCLSDPAVFQLLPTWRSRENLRLGINFVSLNCPDKCFVRGLNSDRGDSRAVSLPSHRFEPACPLGTSGRGINVIARSSCFINVTLSLFASVRFPCRRRQRAIYIFMRLNKSLIVPPSIMSLYLGLCTSEV